MDKRTRLIVIAASAGALLIAAAAALHITAPKDTSADFLMPVYFFNPSAATLEAEEHGAPAVTEPRELIDAAINALFSPPRSPSLIRPWPAAEGFLVSYKMNGNILEAAFSPAYGELAPVDEALFRTAFILTMTEVPTVDYVRILPEGVQTAEGTGYLSAEDYELNTAILPNRVTSRQFTLYFVNEAMDGLVKRVHTSDRVDMDQEEIYIINQIIAEQTGEGVYAAIPPETKVSVELDEGTSTCYVNFSRDIERFSGSQSLAALMLYSIVNSLTDNLVHVRRVQFQIDSEVVEEFYGVTGFNQVFEMNEALVLE